MAIIDFIISALNLLPDSISSFDSTKENDILHIYITLNDKHPTCPYREDKVIVKGYLDRVYYHLPFAGNNC